MKRGNQIAGAVAAALTWSATLFGAESNSFSIIPQPAELEPHGGFFQITPTTRVVGDAAASEIANVFAEKLRTSTGYPFTVDSNDFVATSNTIRFIINGSEDRFGPEGYRLIVESNGVSIIGQGAAGLFYGSQTLLQLFSPEIFSAKPVSNSAWQIPCVRIEDSPRFPWRGFMLDASRHFFGKEEIKRVLDLMALHKLNMFHWHLTDDQGWRIEIRRHPKLTEIGAWRMHDGIPLPRERVDNRVRDNAHPEWARPPASAFGPDGRYGGFYTQDDVREIVAYAAARQITVVPEIEMPGHAIAALAAYPELSCDGGHYSTDVNAGINNGVFCIGDEHTIKFIEDVLTEVLPLFPGKYIHIGGDEVNPAIKKITWGRCASCKKRMKELGLKNEDELQSWFIGRIDQFVRAHGKTLVGWSEIAEGGLPPNAVVMDWRGGALQAATNDHDVVMSPTRFCYLDYYQSLDRAMEPHAFGGFLPLEKVYSFEPISTAIPPQFQSHILGAQGNLWTEFVESLSHVEYMAFPRLCAIAEVDWSPKSGRDWNDFSRRLRTHYRRLDELGVNYRPETEIEIGHWAPAELTTNDGGTNLQWDVSSIVGGPAEYRITFEFDRGDGLTISSVTLLEQGIEVARDSHPGFAGHRSHKPVYIVRVPRRKRGAAYKLQAHVIGSRSFGKIACSIKPLNNAHTEGSD